MKLDSFCRRLQKIVMIALYIKTDSIYISILNVLLSFNVHTLRRYEMKPEH